MRKKSAWQTVTIKVYFKSGIRLLEAEQFKLVKTEMVSTTNDFNRQL